MKGIHGMDEKFIWRVIPNPKKKKATNWTL
jgi:hypothetical protein